MCTTEQIPVVDKESSPVSLSQCYDKTPSASAPIVEAGLSTAIAADSRQQAASSVLEGSLSTRIFSKDDPADTRHDGR